MNRNSALHILSHLMDKGAATELRLVVDLGMAEKPITDALDQLNAYGMVRKVVRPCAMSEWEAIVKWGPP